MEVDSLQRIMLSRSWSGFGVIMLGILDQGVGEFQHDTAGFGVEVTPSGLVSEAFEQAHHDPAIGWDDWGAADLGFGLLPEGFMTQSCSWLRRGSALRRWVPRVVQARRPQLLIEWCARAALCGCWSMRCSSWGCGVVGPVIEAGEGAEMSELTARRGPPPPVRVTVSADECPMCAIEVLKSLMQRSFLLFRLLLDPVST